MSGSDLGLDLSALAGNAPLKRQLELQTAHRGLSHAYIISGPPGSGRHTLAKLLSAALVCAGQGDRLPCGRCAACRKARAGVHPDIIPVGDDGKDLSVTQVRQMRTDAYIRPNEAERKVYVLSNAQSMNASAQNAMLKLLEEGPAYAAFLLITDNAAALLPTVRSRCEALALSPVTPDQAEAWLRAAYPDKPVPQLHALADSCEGLLGRAAAALEGGEADRQAGDTARRLLSLLAAEDERGLMELCISLEKWDRDRLSALLDEAILLLRDALLCAAGALDEADPLREEAARQASALSPRRLLAAAAHLKRLRSACAFNIGAGHLAGWLCAGLLHPVP
ncbi:ATP-binding protein [Lawsonibacter celer]|uniref:DNA polymerase III subunit n=1 Tax=Lawsonibacter celer TaxID=2986526 RepID=UPI001FABF7E9|nr:DNA polymerase III subunit [Lawsonibacter celer]